MSAKAEKAVALLREKAAVAQAARDAYWELRNSIGENVTLEQVVALLDAEIAGVEAESVAKLAELEARAALDEADGLLEQYRIARDAVARQRWVRGLPAPLPLPGSETVTPPALADELAALKLQRGEVLKEIHREGRA